MAQALSREVVISGGRWQEPRSLPAVGAGSEDVSSRAVDVVGYGRAYGDGKQCMVGYEATRASTDTTHRRAQSARERCSRAGKMMQMRERCAAPSANVAQHVRDDGKGDDDGVAHVEQSGGPGAKQGLLSLTTTSITPDT